MPAEGRDPDLRQAIEVTRPRRLAQGPATPLEGFRSYRARCMRKLRLNQLSVSTPYGIKSVEPMSSKRRTAHATATGVPRASMR
jgi:hypothetical protein